ncbi:MAG: hypothetical protein D6820_13800, partial [Lentisphaerae bacterium]
SVAHESDALAGGSGGESDVLAGAGSVAHESDVLAGAGSVAHESDVLTGGVAEAGVPADEETAAAEAAEEVVTPNPYTPRPLVVIEDEQVLLDPKRVLALIPEDQLLVSREEILEQVGGELIFALSKEEVLEGVKKGALVLPLNELFLHFSFELFTPEGGQNPTPIELPLEEMMAYLPPEWLPSAASAVVANLNESSSVVEEEAVADQSEVSEDLAKAPQEDVVEQEEEAAEQVAAEQIPAEEPVVSAESPEVAMETVEPPSDTVPEQEVADAKKVPAEDVIVGIPASSDHAPDVLQEPVEVKETMKLPRPGLSTDGPKVSIPSPRGVEIDTSTDTETLQVPKGTDFTPVHEPENVLSPDELARRAEEVFGSPDVSEPESKEVTEEKEEPVWQSQAPFGININRAGVEQFCKLSGVGPYLAAQIIEYRQANGAFRRLNDLLKVPGLGPKTYKEMTGLSSRSSLQSAEQKLAELAGLKGVSRINLAEVVHGACEKLNFAAIIVSNVDGLRVVEALRDEKMKDFSEALSSVAPQLLKRSRKTLKQAKMPQAQNISFVFKRHTVTFCGDDQVFVALIHPGSGVSQRQLSSAQRFVDQLVWYCSYRAVL